MIELNQVTKTYEDRIRAVDEVSFTVGEGEVFGIVGTSGCGKTTTLKMINRLIEPTSGRIVVNGTDIKDSQPEKLRRNIGYVIQNIGLFPHYSIAENISVVPNLLQWDKKRVKSRVTELLNLVGLDPGEFAGRSPETLSGGQQQRVGLARALAADPPVILMDEPFGALDPITKEQIQQEFKNLLREIRKTIILVTHDVFEAFDLCDRIGLMDEGRLKQTGSPKDLLFQPADAFTRSFFDSHRFQLELLSITTRDVCRLLEPAERSRKEAASFDAETPFLELFQSVEQADREMEIISVNDEQGEVDGFYKTAELMSGFYRARSRLRQHPGGSDG